MATIGAIEFTFQSVANAAAIITFLGVVWGAFWLGIRSRIFWDNFQNSIKKNIATDVQKLLDAEREQIRAGVQQELSQSEERRNTRTDEAIERIRTLLDGETEQIRTGVQQELSQLEERRNTRTDEAIERIRTLLHGETEQIRASVQQELSQLEERRNTRIEALDNQIKGIDSTLSALRRVFGGRGDREGV